LNFAHNSANILLANLKEYWLEIINPTYANQNTFFVTVYHYLPKMQQKFANLTN